MEGQHDDSAVLNAEQMKHCGENWRTIRFVIISNSLNAVSINLRKQLEHIENIHLVSISVIVLPRCLEQMEAIGD
mgnify:CR=1 FL=1